MIICCVAVVIVSHFTFSITLFVLDGDAWPQGLATCNREVGDTTTRFSLANVLANTYLDALVSQ